MANDNFSRGLYPLRYNPDAIHAYRVSTAVDLYLGMPVALDANGEVAPIGVNTAGVVKVLGSVVGFLTNPAGAPLTTDPFLDVSDITAGDISQALVADDPSQEFVIQEDTGGTALTQADAGLGATMIFMTGSGNANTGWTNLEIDRSTATATTGGQVMLLRPLQLVNTDGTDNVPGNYCKWVVRLLNHQKNFVETLI